MNKKVYPIIVVLVAVASFLAGATITKKSQGPQTAGSGNVSISPQPTLSSPLALENLKKYASELGLDTTKFNQCLDNREQAKRVKEDLAFGDALNVQGTPTFFVNGRFVGGPFPFNYFKEIIDKELAGEGSSNPKDYSFELQQLAVAQQGGQAPFNPKPVKVEVANSDLQTGPKEASVTIVEFLDFQCPACIDAYSTVKQILEEYKEKIRFVFKNYPLDSSCNSQMSRQLHPFACRAAEAGFCANDQGKFWEYHRKLFESQ